MTLSPTTLTLLLAGLALTGTLSSSVAAQLATTSPRAAAVLRVIAAVCVDLRAAWLALGPTKGPPP
jgi:predicted benzoate:H+ symporter BenE